MLLGSIGGTVASYWMGYLIGREGYIIVAIGGFVYGTFLLIKGLALRSR